MTPARSCGLHPLVRTVLTNRRREGYAGWHDGANRNRLLAAAGELDPEWVMFLDADECVDEDDARCSDLRGRRGAPRLRLRVPGLPHVRERELRPDYEWVYRLFRHQPGQRLPHARLDFTPVPIAVRNRVETTLRIKHYGEVGLGDARREWRSLETDPDW